MQNHICTLSNCSPFFSFMFVYHSIYFRCFSFLKSRLIMQLLTILSGQHNGVITRTYSLYMYVYLTEHVMCSLGWHNLPLFICIMEKMGQEYNRQKCVFQITLIAEYYGTYYERESIITSSVKGGYVLVVLVCLFVCLFVCLLVSNITPKVGRGRSLPPDWPQ